MTDSVTHTQQSEPEDYARELCSMAQYIANKHPDLKAIDFVRKEILVPFSVFSKYVPRTKANIYHRVKAEHFIVDYKHKGFTLTSRDVTLDQLNAWKEDSTDD